MEPEPDNTTMTATTTATTTSTPASSAALLELPPPLLQRILGLLVAEPRDLLHVAACSRAARAAVDDDDDSLWLGFCAAVPGLPRAALSPAAWGAVDAKHLWLGLLRPYGALLSASEERLFESLNSIAGVLLRVDAEPPCLRARSLYFASLTEATPRCHLMFEVQLPPGPPRRKAVVTCWRDRHADDVLESAATLRPLAADSDDEDAQHPVLAAAAIAAAAADGLGLAGGFELCCAHPDAAAGCNSCVTEFLNRSLRGRPYAEARGRRDALGGGGDADSDDDGEAGGGDGGGGGGVAAAAAAAAAGGNHQHQHQHQHQQQLLPLPDVAPGLQADWAQVMPLTGQRPPEPPVAFRPRLICLWSAPYSVAALARALPRGCDAGAALRLAQRGGLWRGTYGAHGVEIVSLTLVEAAAGANVFGDAPGAAAAAGPAAAFEADDRLVERRPGRLLDLLFPEAAAAAGGVVGQALPSNPAAAAGDGGGGGGGGGGGEPMDVDNGGEQQQQPQQQQQQQQQPQRPPSSKVLLLAKKITGDTNVPAGVLTFVADLGTRDVVGVGVGGEPLALPPRVDSDVALNAPNARRLAVRERYRARAQIAFSSFSSPSVIAAELLLFEGEPDAFGLVWKEPVVSFSLFTRLPPLPK